MTRKSKGHLFFEGPWEYFEFTPPGQSLQIYRAPIENPMEEWLGVRAGARFEAYAKPWYASRKRR